MSLELCILQYDKMLPEWEKQGMIGKWVVIPSHDMEHPIYALTKEECFGIANNFDNEICLVREIVHEQKKIHCPYTKVKTETK